MNLIAELMLIEGRTGTLTFKDGIEFPCGIGKLSEDKKAVRCYKKEALEKVKNKELTFVEMAADANYYVDVPLSKIGG